MKFLFIAMALSQLTLALAQISTQELVDIDNDDLNIGSDIFADYNEDIDAAQVVEDERFWRYGRFFGFSVGVGSTAFTGNRGSVTENEPPNFSLGINYWLNFRVSYTLGVEVSKHNMLFSGLNSGFGADSPGLVEVTFIRPYFGIRYHIDTSDLGTALTYSNPYLTARMEYWIQKNEFIDSTTIPDESGGGVGLGLGGGLEFPIVLKEYYIGVEFLYHFVNYFDKFRRDFAATTGSIESVPDLNGDALSIFVRYVVSW